ncbi:MAG: extracellular solute-binding protein [Candidatus Yanofskybacteria bacterium]|nr:extracellular solute-binding protein [Candidatus Yanofskybacteria bacterium]
MSQTKLLIIGGAAGLAVIILLMFLVLGSFGGGVQEKITLQFWGTFDESSFYHDAIADFEKSNPNINVMYRQFNFEDYEKQLIDSFAAGTGPDVWLMHNTWLPKHYDKIQPLPQQLLAEDKKPLLTFKEFQEQFVDVAVEDLAAGAQIYALPLYVDTLALYYNKDLLNSAGIVSPPSNWDEFNDAVKKLTVFDGRGNILRSGAAIGTAKNINRSTDILALLMLQSGVKMTNTGNTAVAFSDPVGGVKVGETALQYYTDFARQSNGQTYTWNDSQHYSVDAFIEGNVAMMFNYSHHVKTIRDKSARFNFAIASIPQISDTPIAVNYANYWAPTVSKQSKYSDAAWKFLVYLSSAKGATFYLNASGRPSARRDLIEQQKTDPDLGAFAVQALSAKSWYQIDNSAIETIFADMISDVNFGRASAGSALQAAENKVNVLMSRSRGSF